MSRRSMEALEGAAPEAESTISEERCSGEPWGSRQRGDDRVARGDSNRRVARGELPRRLTREPLMGLSESRLFDRREAKGGVHHTAGDSHGDANAV
jgi:hypothetical protein